MVKIFTEADFKIEINVENWVTTYQKGEGVIVI